MKLLVLFLSVYSFSSLACRCVFKPVENLAKSHKVIFEGEVLFSDSNKTLVQVTDILKSTVELEENYIGGWFIFEGTKDNASSCPGNNVMKIVGTKVMFFPELEKSLVNTYHVDFFSSIISHCGSFYNYFEKGSDEYETIIKLIE